MVKVKQREQIVLFLYADGSSFELNEENQNACPCVGTNNNHDFRSIAQNLTIAFSKKMTSGTIEAFRHLRSNL